MAIALHHSRATGSAKVVLIGIANHEGDGGSWPSVATLAKYANVDPRRVQAALTKLEILGEIRRDRQAGGTAATSDHRRPNLYHFLLRCPSECDHSMNHRVRVTKTSPGDENVTGTGDENVTLTVHVNPTTTNDPAPPHVSKVAISAGGGRAIAHKDEPNARRSLERLRTERRLPLSIEELLAHAYRLGAGNPWSGYLEVKQATSDSFEGVRDPAAVCRARLRKAVAAA